MSYRSPPVTAGQTSKLGNSSRIDGGRMVERVLPSLITGSWGPWNPELRCRGVLVKGRRVADRP